MNTRKQTVLIIDDDARNIFALSAVLRSRGIECVTAQGVTEGIEIIESGTKIDTVLIDMMMPDIDGYEGIASIIKLTDAPVIAVTAQAMVGDMERCLAAGAEDYISKPVDVDKLMEVLNNLD